MNPTPLLVVLVIFSSLISGIAQEREEAKQATNRGLPSVAGFEPKRYLGKWHEVARLPAAIQPAGTLAIAEYSAGKEAGEVVVKNTAYSRDGKVLSTIEGKAELVAGDPPGRLLVGFGPVRPKAPNYYVLHVDKDYQHAVVGVPDRKSLWILAREVPVPKQKLDELQKIARDADFDTTKLIVAPWDEFLAAKK